MLNKIFFIIACILFLSVSPLYSQEKADEYVLKLGSLAPEGSVYMELIRELWDRVYKETGGRVNVKYYPGGVLGDEPDMVKKMRMGQLQIGAFTSQGILSIAPIMAVMELPFLFESLDEIDYVKEKMFREFATAFEKQGFFLLTFVDQGGFLNFYSVNPIKTLDDLKKEKVWAWADEPLSIESIKSLGISPVIVPVPEVLPALQRGDITVVNFSPLACVALQWHSKIKHIIQLNFRYAVGIIVMDLATWNKLPLDIQKTILKINEDILPKMSISIRHTSNKLLFAMTQQGIDIIKMDESEKNKVKEMMLTTHQKFAGSLYPEGTLQKVRHYIEEYRKIQR